MNHSEVFGSSVWVKAAENNICPVIRTVFDIRGRVKSAKLNILGLGTYVFYVNGQSVTDDLFQPINSSLSYSLSPTRNCMER